MLPWPPSWQHLLLGMTTPDHPANVAPDLTPSQLLFLVSDQLVHCHIPDSSLSDCDEETGG